MKQGTLGDVHSEPEPPLAELSYLRELSRLEVVPAAVERELRRRLQQSSTVDGLAPRRGTRFRTALLAVAFFVVVPSAIAATPVGSVLIEQTRLWVPRVLEFVGVEPGQSSRAEPRPRGAHGAGDGWRAEAPATSGALPGWTPSKPQKSPSGASAGDERVPGESVAPGGGEHAMGGTAPRRSTGGAGSSSMPPQPAASVRSEVARTGGAPTTSSWSDGLDGSGALNAERRMLQQARLLLSVGDARGALELASQHVRRFPDGILVAEREAIIKQARQLEAARP